VAIHYQTQRDVEKHVKKRRSEETEAMVQRLDWLTQDEALWSSTPIFEVLHGLVQNMDGEQIHLWQACRVRDVV